MNFNRNDTYSRSDGPSWFNEFLVEFAKTKQASTADDLLSIITNKKLETVDSVVQNYRKMVGLDLVAEDDSTPTIKQASKNTQPLLSVRASSDEQLTDEIKKIVNSFCEHSDGNKNTYAIIHYLRDQYGPDLINYSNDQLTSYIQSVKNKYQQNTDDRDLDPGVIGLELSDE